MVTGKTYFVAGGSFLPDGGLVYLLSEVTCCSKLLRDTFTQPGKMLQHSGKTDSKNCDSGLYSVQTSVTKLGREMGNLFSKEHLPFSVSETGKPKMPKESYFPTVGF